MQQAIAEYLTFGVKACVVTQSLRQCVRRGIVGRMNTLHEGIPHTVFQGQFDPPFFAFYLARKDLALATELASELSVPLAS